MYRCITFFRCITIENLENMEKHTQKMLKPYRILPLDIIIIHFGCVPFICSTCKCIIYVLACIHVHTSILVKLKHI